MVFPFFLVLVSFFYKKNTVSKIAIHKNDLTRKRIGKWSIHSLLCEKQIKKTE